MDRDMEELARRWVDEVLEYWGVIARHKKSDEAAIIST
jgi:hypothetical protein